MQIRVLTLLLILSLAGCGNERNDTLRPDIEDDLAASLLAATAGMPNVVVTESNNLDFCQELFSLLADSYERAVEQALQIDDDREIRILGNSNGYAVSEGNLAPLTTQADYLESTFRLKYHNYSSSGRLYLAGSIYLEGLSRKKDDTWRILTLFADTTEPNIVEFAGQYRGRILLHRFPINFDSLGNMLDVRGDGPFPSGQPIWLISGNQTLLFDPYARNTPPDSSGAGL